jgi:hypothetical protein
MTMGSETRHFQNSGTISYFAIGGTHFWGHADFHVSIPIMSFGTSEFETKSETGMKVFPMRVENKKLRPYAGIAWHPASLQRGDGAIKYSHTFPLSAGFAYLNGMHMLDAGLSWNPSNSQDYYVNPTTVSTLKTPPISINFTYKVMLETTLSAERDWKSGRTASITDQLASEGKLNGFTLSVGPSSSMYLASSAFNRDQAPYLHQHKIVNVFPEFGVGYYLHQPDVQFNLVYRSNVSEQNAYGTQQRAERQAITFEAYKFLFDYHGFAAFLGPAISHESLNVRHDGESASFNGLKPGLTFGWDIRPNRLQSWLLRTNLRWFPNLDVTMSNGQTVPMDQLEFNFIELVVFPGRMF